MAQPSTRQELIDYCLRKLGAPVLEINVADEQIDDLVDDIPITLQDNMKIIFNNDDKFYHFNCNYFDRETIIKCINDYRILKIIF